MFADKAAIVSKLEGIARYEDVRRAPRLPNEELGRQEFLTLFTTQLMNQDPLDPVKNEAFVAQLAQFSQLEATTRMATSMDSLVDSLRSERLMSGSQLIGRRVAAPNGNAQLTDGGAISGLISIPRGADEVTLDVFDLQGNKVYTQTMGRQAPGDVTVRWDGTTQDGGRAPEGSYRIVASVRSFGEVTKVPISSPSVVRGVVYSPARNDLILELEDGSTVPLSQVLRIDA